ncbi:holo-[acyl-carrier-protein] synthase [Kwoniella shandongensis]|uniref:Holo-[acyl-carrier-protein] synthase n=1 Tax=Kwoniella shandongensis TaxID=1734106 RepID=A0A5M6C0S0_9TREE|nr:holo-[acyl-carrier-protein] synthase [Kwoniella shandongensis]KAA5527602.1 holo-[acyl-carrier-protein] synthase [Kwoniella shandongensis]
MIVGIGIDILSLSRIRELILRRGADKLAKRICTEGEYSLFKEIEQPPRGSSIDQEVLDEKRLRFLSSRWTLKEASYKSLASHLPGHPPTWKSLEITHSPSGQPILRPTDRIVAEKYSLMGSLSHDAGVVVGVVIAQRSG